ncbi:pPIWI_RE_Z domain-containing protein [Larkinella soli]|uniref:pPIWI_RE_Z domain-containing protein n=1 Tax=Larkinella soli TaxID=1770527 RepID=UPI000FFB78B3|nr:hypothetical protein [Larkinella soli]
MNVQLSIPHQTARFSGSHLMRWQEPLSTQLRYQHELPGQVANRLLNVELGLFVLAELLPLAPPQALSDLLNGEGAAYEQRPVWTPRQHRYLSRARTLLAPYRNRLRWLAALEKYERLPETAKAFTLHGAGGWGTAMSGIDLRKRRELFQAALK